VPSASAPTATFNSPRAARAAGRGAYLGALLADLERDAHLAGGRPVVSVFIGGGTPSLVSGAFVGRLLESVDRRLGLAAGAEITLEANRDAGGRPVSRLPDRRGQSPVARHPEPRRPVPGGAGPDPRGRGAGRVDLARAAGFASLNLDLMHGLPGQTVREALADLAGVLALGPEHVSWYQLTIEPNTPSRPRLRGPGRDQLAEMEEGGFSMLAASGYEHYEFSAHARPGFRCRHKPDLLGISATT